MRGESCLRDVILFLRYRVQTNLDPIGHDNQRVRAISRRPALAVQLVSLLEFIEKVKVSLRQLLWLLQRNIMSRSDNNPSNIRRNLLLIPSNFRVYLFHLFPRNLPKEEIPTHSQHRYFQLFLKQLFILHSIFFCISIYFHDGSCAAWLG